MGNAKRQFLKNDPKTIGSGPAMLSASQVPYKVDDIVYEADVVNKPSRYDDEDKTKLQVTAHRVVQVNYQYRRVMIRCANGCERVLQYGGDACLKTKYWHTLAEARQELLRGLGEAVRYTEKEVVRQEKRLANLHKLEKDAVRFNVIKLPAKVADPHPVKS